MLASATRRHCGCALRVFGRFESRRRSSQKYIKLCFYNLLQCVLFRASFDVNVVLVFNAKFYTGRLKYFLQSYGDTDNFQSRARVNIQCALKMHVILKRTSHAVRDDQHHLKLRCTPRMNRESHETSRRNTSLVETGFCKGDK